MSEEINCRGGFGLEPREGLDKYLARMVMVKFQGAVLYKENKVCK